MKNIVFVLGVMLSSVITVAQTPVQYRRSSITKVMLPVMSSDGNDSIKGYIKDAFLAHRPETYDYNDLRIDLDNLSKGEKQTDDEFANDILNELNRQKVAQRIILQWYGANKGAEPSIELIERRAMYDASSVSRDLAARTERGYAVILDGAAEDLISHSFVMVTAYRWLSGEELKNTLAVTGELAISKLPNAIAQVAAKTALDITLSSIDLKNYYVKTNTYLYKLEWNKELQDEFEIKYWGETNLNKTAEFMNSSKYSLTFVGQTDDKSIAIGNPAKAAPKATVRATDGCFAELQKKNDIFKPLYQAVVTDDGVESEVGMKDGIKGGEKFEIIRVVLNADGTMKLESDGKLTVAKGQVCDNRVYLDGEKPENDLKRTKFKGKGPKGQTSFMIRLK